MRAITLVLLLAAAAGAAAHGGALHETTPESSNYLRTKIATCDTWKAPALDTVKYSLRAADAPLPQAKPEVQGTVIIWAYLYSNCSLAAGEKPSAGAHFNVTLTDAATGKPVEGQRLNGIAMTGSCAQANSRPFYLNASAVPLDDPHNLLWFTNHTTGADGVAAGNGANDGDVRTTADGRGVRSALLVDAGSGAALSCCDLVPSGPANTDWSATLKGKGVECVEDADGHKKPKAALAGEDAHAGHDHDMHAGHDHNATAAAPAAAKPATSGAGVRRAAAGGVAVAAALAALL